MSPERNDPCPCGSGKKFKKCCLGTSSEPHVEGLPSANDIDELGSLYAEQNKWLTDELSERTPAEVGFDDVLLAALRDGKSIQESVDTANAQYPDEALEYDTSNIGDIESHYTYLLDHLDLKEKFARAKKRLR